MKVILGADQAGWALKEGLKTFLLEKNFEVVDVSEKPAIDFVDAALAVGAPVLEDEKEETLGILLDAYGAGGFMALTKQKGLIAAEVSDERSAYMTRSHNNARVIVMGSEIVGVGLAQNIALEFLNGKYAAGRHQIRVDMLNKMA